MPPTIAGLDPDWLLAKPAEHLSGYSIWTLKAKAKRGLIRARIAPNGRWEWYRPDLLRLAAAGRRSVSANLAA